MKITLLLLISGVAACFCDAILRNDFDTPSEDGSYRWAFQTEGGIFHEQRGSYGDNGAVVEGQYQYTAPDGQVINIIYRADENGFHASGAHLPTSRLN